MSTLYILLAWEVFSCYFSCYIQHNISLFTKYLHNWKPTLVRDRDQFILMMLNVLEMSHI